MEEKKNKLAEGQNPLLIWGIVYVVILSLIIWLIYGFRAVQIQSTSSQIDAIKKEIISQVGEEELAQLETISGQIAVLYGKPFATTMLKDIASAIPKNAKLSAVSFSGNQINLQGTAASYDEVSLFATTLSNQASTLKTVEIASASQSSLLNQSGVDFTLQANIK